MKYRIIITLVLFFYLSCKQQDNEIGKPDCYTITDRSIYNDCTVYQMLIKSENYKKGNWLFRVALSGSCKNLTMQEYIKEYSKYLNINQDNLRDKRGYIIIEYHGFKNSNNTLQDSILNITKRNFNANVSLKEIEEDRFTIEVYDKKN